MITVGEVHLPVVDDLCDLIPPGEKLRLFQKQFIDCVEKDTADIIQLIAPTGAGKTLCFEYLLRKREKVLLIYPTNALIQSQMERFKKSGYSTINISSKILTRKGQERSQELWGLIQRYDIILTNPDIFQAIIGHMYTNPEENLIQAFSFFSFVIYDEFHAYGDFELSGILTQIALFQNMSRCKVILSSATPKSEIIGLLNLVRIGTEKHAPLVENVIAESCKPDDGRIIRYQTIVHLRQGKIIDYIDEISNVLNDALIWIQSSSPQILFIFDTVKDSNRFYARLFKEYPEIYEYAEKDNGYDTNQTGDKPDFTKPILISTNKSEVGLDYPIKLLFTEDGFSIDSFVQRFGRAARHEPATCHIYTKMEINSLFADDTIEYQAFLDKMDEVAKPYNINAINVRTLFTFRQALAIQKYNRRQRDIETHFSVESGSSYKLWLYFFDILDSQDKQFANKNLDRLNLLVSDIKDACQSLRGRSLQFPVLYQRGHETRQTMYDVLSVLNRVPAVVEKTKDGLVIREIESTDPGPFIEAVKVQYFPVLIDYQKRREQFKDEIDIIIKDSIDVFPEKQRGLLTACIRSLSYAIEPDRIMLPEEIILWNKKVVPLSADALEYNDD